MDITIHVTALPHDDPEESLAFYRDALGFEIRQDVGTGKVQHGPHPATPLSRSNHR